MKKEYRIKISKAASRDLENIGNDLRRYYENTATNMYDEFVTKVSNLKLFPFMYPLAKDKRLSKKGYRILVVGNYLVFYTVDNTIVSIRRIIHGKQNYLTLLE